MKIANLEKQANKGMDIGLDNDTLRELVGYVRDLEKQVDSLANNKLDLLESIRCYLVAAEDGSMSRNNSRALAGELLEELTLHTKIKS